MYKDSYPRFELDPAFFCPGCGSSPITVEGPPPLYNCTCGDCGAIYEVEWEEKEEEDTGESDI